MLVALDVLNRECECVAVSQHNFVILKGLDAVFGTFGVEHNCNRQLELVPYLFDKLNVLFVSFVIAVRKVKSGNAHARFAHFGQHLFVLAGRTDSADDFSFSHFKPFCM